MKAHVHARVLRRMTRGGSRREKKGDDLASAPGDIDAGREVWLARRDKALYAQHGAGVKELERRLLNITHSVKTAHAQHDQPAHLRLQSPERDETVYSQHGRGVAEVGGSADLTPLQLKTLFCACCLAVDTDQEYACRLIE